MPSEEYFINPPSGDTSTTGQHLFNIGKVTDEEGIG